MPLDPDEFYTKGAEKFAKNHRLDDRPGVKKSLEKFCGMLEGDNILDAGCGPVEEPDVFVEKGYDYTGIDIAPGMIEYAREHRSGKFYVMDMRDMEFSGENFDGVWCNASVFFVPPEEMKKAVNELERVLKNSGVLYINFKLGEGSFLKEKYGEEIRQYLVGEDEVREILESAGFRVEDFSRAELQNVVLGEYFCRL